MRTRGIVELGPEQTEKGVPTPPPSRPTGATPQDGASRLREAPGRIDRPVLMINQSDDEIFSRESTFRLYDALSGPKRVFFYPGGHSGVPPAAMERVREFLHAQLADESIEGDAPKGTW